MDIDDRSRLRNVMWIHPRSRVAYEEFHDVVSFNTTYCLNRYQMPLAVVVGINHHHHSTLLGYVLLTHEQTDSFRWFFTNWLAAMGGVQPKAILTDQYESINIALREIMPNTVHRFCMWNIVSKIQMKFGGIKNYTKTAAAFKNMIHHSLSIDDFETRWADFLVKYNMSGNEWLASLYEQIAKWVPIYLVDHFWAEMVSTQRSESMNAYFDHYITPKSTLKMFVEQYEIAITNKIEKELHAEYQSKCTFINRRTKYEWEEQFGRVYTNNVFSLLHEELEKVIYCNLKQLDKSSDDATQGIERYEVCEKRIIDNWFHTEFTYSLEYRPVGSYLFCRCRKFQSKGIFCCHLLKLIIFKGIQLVEYLYILRRWRKDRYRPYMGIFFAGGYPHMSKEYKLFPDVEKVFVECTDIAYKKQKRMDHLRIRMEEIKKELTLMDGAADSDFDEGEDSDDPSTEINVLNPKQTKRRGRPRKKHYKSTMENNQKRASAGRGDSNTGDGGRGRGRGRSTQDHDDTVIGTQGSIIG